MEKNKKLNLTKYAYLDYLKGDIFSWLNCNENYKKAAKEDEILKKATPWRYKDSEDEENDFDIDDFYSELRYGIKPNQIDLTKEVPDQIKAGLRVGEYSERWAKLKWPNHEIVTINGFDNIENVKKTNELLESDRDLIIFEANFTYNEFVIRTDILIKTKDSVEIIEVKGSGSTKLLYAMDLFFQKEIIERSNSKYKDWNYSLLLLDKEYINNSNYSKDEKASNVFIHTNMVTNAHNLGSKKIPEYDPEKNTSWRLSLNDYWYNPLEEWISFDEKPEFKEVTGKGKNFTFEIEYFFNSYLVNELREKFDETLENIKEIQLLDTPPKLEFETKNNQWMKSEYIIWALNVSGAYDVEDSIFDFKGTKLNWNHKCFLFKKGIRSMKEPSFEEIVPGTLYKKYGDLTDEQAIMEFLSIEEGKGVSGFSAPIQRNYFDKEEFLVHRKLLNKELEPYDKGPIYMYDFETANLAIPEVDGANPYEQIVYQYSIHVILDPINYDFKTMKNIVHYEWLAEDRDNFHINAWNNFVKPFKEHGEGVYVAWNDSFEKNCIKRALDNWSFDKDVQDTLEMIKEETIDLMIPFRNKYYYHKELKGSYSIKYAGPHFASEIDYKNLSLVQRGDQSAAVAKMWLRERTSQSDIDWKSRRKDMLKYCEYDTLLMVAILQRLKEKIND